MNKVQIAGPVIYVSVWSILGLLFEYIEHKNEHVLLSCSPSSTRGTEKEGYFKKDHSVQLREMFAQLNWIVAQQI